jgi:hypothetical protein
VRTNADGTQLIARPRWENRRIHALSDIWLLTIVAILIATSVPWFANGFEVDIGAGSWGLLAVGGIQGAFTILSSRKWPHDRWHD